MSNSTSSAIRRKILVVGATGKQGRALIQALLDPDPVPSHLTSSQNHDATGTQEARSSGSNTNEDVAWDILALTRNPATPRAQSLLQLLPESSPHTIDLIEGDIGNEESIRGIFERESESPGQNGIWGVFAVLMFPGLGVKIEHTELKQGKVIPSPLAYKLADPSPDIRMRDLS